MAYGSALAHLPGRTSHGMEIPPGYASVGLEEICHPQFEDLKLEIPGGDDEKTLKDAVHGIILWPKRYIIIPDMLAGSNPPRDTPQPPPSSPGPSSRPSRSPRSPCQDEPFNLGGASSSDDSDDIPPKSPPKQPPDAKQVPKRSRA